MTVPRAKVGGYDTRGTRAPALGMIGLTYPLFVNKYYVFILYSSQFLFVFDITEFTNAAGKIC